jgi:hypothetical protein
LDDLKPPSAYKQAKKLWDSNCPGDCFASSLQKIRNTGKKGHRPKRADSGPELG